MITRILLTALILTSPTKAFASLECPMRLEEITPHPFERHGLGAGRGANSPLEEVWVIDGLPGHEAAGAPTILAPDDQRGRAPRVMNTWRLNFEERLLVCIYGGGAYLRATIPPAAKQCVQMIEPGGMRMRCS